MARLFPVFSGRKVYVVTTCFMNVKLFIRSNQMIAQSPFYGSLNLSSYVLPKFFDGRSSIHKNAFRSRYLCDFYRRLASGLRSHSALTNQEFRCLDSQRDVNIRFNICQLWPLYRDLQCSENVKGT